MKYNKVNYYGNEMSCVYPRCCQSACCGKSGSECNEICTCWPRLQEWKKWVRDNNAKCADEIWSPNVYVARR